MTKVFIWLEENYYTSDDVGIQLGAASGGNIKILEYIKNTNKVTFLDRMAFAAAKKNHFDATKWLLCNGCTWDFDIATKAAELGNLEFLIWAKEKGYRLNATMMITMAVQEAKMNIITWMVENGIDLARVSCTQRAAETGNLELLKYLRKNGCCWQVNTFESAVSIDNLEMVLWLDKEGCPWIGDKCIYIAAQKGSFKVLKWLWEKGFQWNETTFENAVISGNVDMVMWMKEMKCPYDGKKCLFYAIQFGNLDVAKYLYEIGCAWDENCTVIAARNGYLPVTLL